MRKTALLVALGLALVLGRAAEAQGPFADVPTDHWAYDAVNQLAAQGIFTGYPDGTFGGKRALTRYEFAIAIQRMLQDVQRRIDEAVKGRETPPPVGTAPDGTLRSDIDKLKAQQDQLRRDVDTLRRLATEFQDTLATLGTDVDQLKRDLAALSDRVRNIEDQLRKMPKISGTANLAFISRYADNPEDFAGAEPQVPSDYDGRPFGESDNFYENILPIYDIDLGITARLSDVATAHLLINAGNYLVDNGEPGTTQGYLNGSVSSIYPVGETGQYDVIPYYAYIDAPVSVGSFGANITVGKFGHQFTPYTLRMGDPDWYIDNEKTESGNYPILGGRVNFRIGGFNVQAYAGRHRDNRYGDLTSTRGMGVVPAAGAPFLQLGQPLFVGNPLTGGPTINPVIDQSFGGRVSFSGPLKSNIGATFLEGAGSTNADTFRRLQVYGGDINLQLFGFLGIGGDFAQSEWKDRTGAETSRTTDKANQAWDGRLTGNLGKLALTGFYRRIGNNFDAPGAWFDIGRWKNPRGLEGYGGRGSYPLSNKIALNVEGAVYNIIGARDNEVTHWKAGLGWRFTPSNRIDLGIENVDYDAGIGDESTERYINVGFGHQFNPNLSFRFLWQFINFDAGAVDILPNADYDANVAVTQFTVRF
jgi:hypothetical protein